MAADTQTASNQHEICRPRGIKEAALGINEDAWDTNTSVRFWGRLGSLWQVPSGSEAPCFGNSALG
eukprot:1338898-Alexandrium_andersonii.AAC.1